MSTGLAQLDAVSVDDRPLPILPEAAVISLYDGTKRISYALALDIVDLMSSSPELRDELRRAGQERLRRRPIPLAELDRQWHWLLGQPDDVFASSILELSDRGELLRDTMPFAGVIPEPRRLEIARYARNARYDLT